MHIDTMRMPKFDRPGHWATGGRQVRSRGAGTVYVVSVVDDHSRLAYCELHSAEDRWSTTATLRRAAAWMTEQGCGPLEGLSGVLCGVGVTDRPVGAGKASHVQAEVDIQRGRVVSVRTV